ncbi:MAG: phosphoribosyl-AMP cyclohydrolase [Bacteroidia bacterium]|nr:phosphoribosyl-AMP cyclohydrolase [Bacteroidia bacterium]
MNYLFQRTNLNTVSVLFLGFLLMTLISCNGTTGIPELKGRITEAEISTFQKSFGMSIVAISNAYKNNGDYKYIAQNHVEKYYGFDDGKVLFKASNSNDLPFRSTYEGALSYYIGNNPSYPDDNGFALADWVNVNWKNAGIINDEKIAIAIGQSVYKDANGDEYIKNYTMCFKKDMNDRLMLIAHKSSSPCI